MTHGQHVQERLGRITIGQRLVDRGRRAFDIDGGQNAAVERHEVRRELNTDRTACGFRKLLIELAQVPMGAPRRIGMRAARQFRMQQVFLQRPPGAADPGFQVNDDIVKVDHPGLDQRAQRVLAGSRIAAGPRDQPRLGDFGTVELGQPVDGFLLQFQRRMRFAVPSFIFVRVAQAKVGRQIDHFQPARQIRDHRLAGRVRQGAKHQIDAGKVDIFDLYQTGQIQMREERKHFGHCHPGFAVARKRRNLHRRMGGDQADKFRPGIAGRPEDGDSVVHDGLRSLSLR